MTEEVEEDADEAWQVTVVRRTGKEGGREAAEKCECLGRILPEKEDEEDERAATLSDRSVQGAVIAAIDPGGNSCDCETVRERE